VAERAIAAGLLGISLLVGGCLFALLDRSYTRLVSSKPGGTFGERCWAPDPVLHHTLVPNCSGLMGWGREVYPITTNNLGLRDERVRDVPLVVAEPRILLLGDSFMEGIQAWPGTIAAFMQAALPQFRFLNGGRASYSPSNYLRLARQLIAAGLRFDEAIVFLDISDIQDEAAYYRDNEETGGLEGPPGIAPISTWYSRRRIEIAFRYFATDLAFSYLEHLAIRSGIYFKPLYSHGNVFDLPRSAWTYRPVSDTQPYVVGYAPLGVEGGIAKAKTNMTLLQQELADRGIPLSLVVYPWPQTLVHDRAESRHVALWRDWCAGRCKRFVSLFPEFFAIRDACAWHSPGCWYDYFLFGDVHFNERGNRLVADAVVRRLGDDPPRKTP
jgi:hypothetical protein